MAHFAKIDENNIVVEVLRIDDEFETFGEKYLNDLGFSGRWIQTSYNTHGNVHHDSTYKIPSNTQHKALRKNYAFVGCTYDETLDAFIPPKPFDRPSYILDPETCLWKPPIPEPEPVEGNRWFWAEKEQEWFLVPNIEIQEP